MLTVLESTISKSQVFLLKKCEYQSFNDTLTNDIIGFEKLGPENFIQL